MATRPDDDAAAGNGELRGVIEHVGSGRRESFRDADELLAFLRAQPPDEFEEAGE